MGFSLGDVGKFLANPSSAFQVATTAAAIGGDIYASRESSRQAEKNRDFQERMSSTSWQRGVADMRAAGINPILAASQGGASAPSGNVAQVPNPTAGAVGRALEARALASTMQVNSASVAAQTAQARKGNAEAALIEAQVPYSAANAQNAYEKAMLDVQLLANQFKESNIQLGISRDYSEAKVKLEMAYQSYMNQMAALGIPAAKAEADFWRAMPEAAWIQKIKELIPSVNIGGKVVAPPREGSYPSSIPRRRR